MIPLITIPFKNYIKFYFKKNNKLYALKIKKNNIIQLVKLIKSFQNYVIFVTDSKKLFNNLYFLKEDLLKLKIFDCKLFISVYKNLLNIDIYQYSYINFNIDSFRINEQLKNIWKVQNIKLFDLIPKYVIQDFVNKDLEISETFYKQYYNIFLEENKIKSYYQSSLENIYYLVQLENNGIIEKYTNKKIIPKYHYDKVITGRLVNTKPKIFQKMKDEDFLFQYKSRFENGRLLLCDWSNIDFRVAIALSKTKIEEKLEDPYIFLAKNVLNKEEISQYEREDFKKKTLAILYGNIKDNILNNTYNKVFELKKKIIIQTKKKQYVQSYFGKIRFFDKDDDLDTKAFSSYIQMTVSDLFKNGISNLIKVFKENNLQSVPIPFLKYDSYCIDVHPNEKDIIKQYIEKALIEKTIPLDFRNYIKFGIKYNE